MQTQRDRCRHEGEEKEEKEEEEEEEEEKEEKEEGKGSVINNRICVELGFLEFP